MCSNSYKKLSAFMFIIVLLGVNINMVFAGSNVTDTDEKIIVKYGSVGDNDENIEKTVYLTPAEFKNLKNMISDLIGKILKSNSYSDVLKNLLKFSNFEKRRPVLYNMLKLLITSSIQGGLGGRFLPLKDTFILSQGWGYNLNFFRDSTYKIISNKKLVFWRYGERSVENDIISGTILIKFKTFNVEAARGSQIGIALKFRGIYIYEAKPITEQSYTFFMGFTENAKSFEIPTIPKY